MTEYEQIRRMHHQEYLLKDRNVNYPAPWKAWRGAKKIIRDAAEKLDESEKVLKYALKLAQEALVLKQSIADNPPLKRIALQQMDGEPVWVVSSDHDGRWGIVQVEGECILFFNNDEVEEEGWFNSSYIFKHKKVIVDYSAELAKHGILDDDT